jgi:hypothetical protein
MHGRSYLMAPRTDPDAWSELIFEYARRIVAPQAPSRYSALFAFTTLEDERTFRHEYRARGDRIWSIERDEPGYVVDFRLVGLQKTPLACALYAERYWRQEPNFIAPPLWEVLLSCPVVIDQLVE